MADRTAPAMAAAGDLAHTVLPDGLGWQNAGGNDAGLLPARPVRKPGGAAGAVWHAGPTLDRVFDGLADFIERHFEPGVLQRLVARAP